MPRVPRLQLSSEFRAAIKNDPRGIVRLAHVIGLTSYTALSRLLHVRRISGTSLNQGRLHQLATAITYTGEVFRG
jgi:hypothetical protein